MSVGEKIKGIANVAKKGASFVMRWISKIKSMIAFFATPVGHVVLYVIAALLIAFLVYILLSVIFIDIGKIVGLEGAAAQSDKDNYELMTELTNSGYDSMLNAEELIDFSLAIERELYNNLWKKLELKN